jgi:hypothetical protein
MPQDNSTMLTTQQSLLSSSSREVYTDHLVIQYIIYSSVLMIVPGTLVTEDIDT